MFKMENKLFLIIFIFVNLIVLIQGEKCYTCNSSGDEDCKIVTDQTDLDDCEFDDDSQCYTQIDASDNIIRGCMLLIDQVGCSDDKCLLCDVDQCNNVDVILECIECNSDQNSNCATLEDPIALSKTDCYKIGSQCFTGVNAEKTYRGCFHNDVASNLNVECPDKDTCIKCSDQDNCNDKVYPSNRLSCHHCAGDQDCNNVQTVETSHPCKNYADVDECYLFGEGLFAQRGCLSDADPSIANCETDELCVKCPGKDCNKQDAIVSKSESCNSCKEDDLLCYGYPMETLHKTCKAFSWNKLECYTYKTDNTIVRDCLYDDYGIIAPVCSTPGICATCEAADNLLCNNLKELAPEDSCIKCDWVDPKCNLENEMPSKQPCYSRPDKKGCYIRTHDTGFERGCIIDLTDDDIIAECQSNDDKTCTMCSEEGCNTQLMESDESCIKCDSGNLDCNNGDQMLVHAKKCYIHPDPDRKGCYTKFDGTNIERGCMSDLSDDAIITECESNGDTCKTCSGEDCNTQSVVKCYSCDSVTDSTCLEEGTNSVTCKNLDDKCLVYVKENGKTVRGCLGELDPFEDDDVTCNTENCDECETDNCNSGIFPIGRLKCLICNSDKDSNRCLIGDPTYASTCVNYAPDDMCFTAESDDSTYIIRGCLSDTDSAAVACKQDNKCEKCDTDNCNTIELTKPPTLSCIQCDGESDENCEWGFNAVDAKPCTENVAFNGPEKCYTYQDGDVVKRGCVNDGDECKVEGVDCVHCNSADGCNNEHKTESKCYVCNSNDVDEEYCTGAIDAGDLVTCSGLQLYETRGCYTHNTGDHIIRGCVSSFSQCIGDEACKICYDPGCNNEDQNVIPPVYPKCYACDSDLDSTCVDKGTISKPCTNLDDTCLVYVKENGRTVRGCTKDLKPEDDGVTCPSDNCNTCATDNCNSERFPIGRLKCLKCKSNEGSDCLIGDQTYSRTCVNYAPDDMCFTAESDDSTYIIRGCLSDTDSAAVACALDNKCEKCDTDNCNTIELTKPPTLSCIQCDGESDENCEWGFNAVDAKPCTENVAFNGPEKCYTYQDGDVVKRGCVNDGDECKVEGVDCVHCNSADGCNNEHKTESKCYVCDSNNVGDEYCTGAIDAGDLVTCSGLQLYETRGCYTHNTGDHIIRGCVSSFSQCIGDEACKICYEPGCNNEDPNVIAPVYPKCYACDSDLDSTCVDKGTISKPCTNLDDTCLVYVKENGRTVRGCTKDLKPEDDGVTCPSDNCNTCATDNCNNAMFPSDRLKCLKCSSAENTNCFSVSDSTYSVTCQNYASNDKCFTIVRDDSTNLIRGCLSDNDNAATECTDANVCEKCDTDNCNTIALSSTPTLSCIQCDGETDEKCEWGFHEDDAELCTEDIFFNDPELCYIHQDGDRVKRGCVNDEELCKEEDEACKTCSGQGCNNEHKTQSNCYVCDSKNADEEYCNSVFEGATTTPCENGDIQFYATRGCYTYNTGEYVHRGCVSSLKEEELTDCQNNDFEACNICYAEGCNNQEPNFANRLYYLSFLTLISISLFIKLLN